ncbi:PQQ-binding-like beta-propeller repeat protein [Fictibacillus fluitans]|uniref:PQQ-binding-like beta-propeller repeat protein n=1 Tax=Fictibacillus fluitans TaxID=3058422 RepID=A0ABT8HT22_9BACL|nr:PQQ-binding-like beta-propeller repeat protein [Fictibacillus sp. NE201]MDN4523923.1 PQQ-binding-like beta-propeller repeat protein [Fictibacillus sp. NE201]
MGFFNTIKNLFSTTTLESKTEKKENNTKPPLKKEKVTTKKSMGKSSAASNPYLKPLFLNNFKREFSLDLKMETQKNWDQFFSSVKKNPKLIGFENRSRRKSNLLFHNDHLMIVQAAGVIEYVEEHEVRQISLKETPFEKMTARAANAKGVVLQMKEKLAFINMQSQQGVMFHFDWQAFTVAMGDDYWLVGTRQTINGPGELYCFDMQGDLKWSTGFKEKFDSVYGEIEFFPYHLQVSTDSTDIFVSSMDRIYRLSVDGTINARVAISELKAAELKQKQKELQRKWSTQPTNEEEARNRLAEHFASQFTISMRMTNMNSPFAGYVHDPETDMLFVLEEDGRVTAWDRHGKLVWLTAFKNNSRFINWVDGLLVVSFEKGETFWINRKGEFVYGVQLPKQAASIAVIPNQEKYLIVCEDNRLYELHKQSGDLIMGSDGHPGMELFQLSGRNIFFDGKNNGQGYFWRAHIDHIWSHFEPTLLTKDGEINTLSEVAPEISETKRFRKKWWLKNNSKNDWFGSRVIDTAENRIYLVEKEKLDVNKWMDLSESERRKEEKKHHLVCYDFEGNEQWRKQILSAMWSLFLSPDGEVIYTSVPDEQEITYMPGHILLISKDGQELAKFKVPAQGFSLDFVSDSIVTVNLAFEQKEDRMKGIISKNNNGVWNLTLKQGGEESGNPTPFGAGIHYEKTPHFEISRLDKKKYVLRSNEDEMEMKVTAAIYEAYESKDNLLLLRFGKRTIQCFNASFEKVIEIKEQADIVETSLGKNTVVVATKSEVKGYSLTGDILWKYSSIPNTYSASVTWIGGKEVYLWVVTNDSESIVSSISEDGKVKNSHKFDKRSYRREFIVSPEREYFVAQTNGSIEIYGITK